MIAKLKKKSNGSYYCSECMMISNLKEPYCCFCGLLFSNWEQVMRDIFMEQEQKNLTSC